MSGYIKKVAVVKQVKSGFSADGGAVSGLVKAETYAGFLRAEVSLLNLAPVAEGSYVFGITDGKCIHVFEGCAFEGESELDLAEGFAFLACFVGGTVSPIAAAACNSAAVYLPLLKEEMSKLYSVDRSKGKGGKNGSAAYDDEAIAEVNYYERKVDKNGSAVLRGTQAEAPVGSYKNEEAVRPFQGTRGNKELSANGQSGESAKSKGEAPNRISAHQSAAPDMDVCAPDEDFYSRMRYDIEKIFSLYEREKDLEAVIGGAKFVRIPYGDNKHYVFGVLFVEGAAKYICYGVPSSNAAEPPKSLKGCSSYIPVGNGGYWLMYQDAKTGVSI